MCAYISKVSEVLYAGGAAVGVEAADPATMGVAYTAALGLTLGAGAAGSGLFEGVNNVMMVVLVASFSFMIAALAPGVDAGLLAHHDLSALPHAVPVLICALVFQNIVPTIVTDLEGDPTKVRTSILAGSAIPLAMYFVFNAAFLGSIAPDEALSAAAVGERISAAMGDGLASLIFPAFSFAAVTSSCTGTARSQLEEFSSLLSDATAHDRSAKSTVEALRPFLPLAVCAPPLAVSLTNPGCFETALELAGEFRRVLPLPHTSDAHRAPRRAAPPSPPSSPPAPHLSHRAGSFGNLVLFGLVPVAMAWSQRDSLQGAAGEADAVASEAQSAAKVSAAHFAAFGLNEDGAPAPMAAAATPAPAGAAGPSFETYLAFHPFDVEPPARASIMAGVRGVRANAAKASRSLALANDRTSGVTRTDYADEFGDVSAPRRTTQLLPGGKPVLGAIGGVSGGLVLSELIHMASASAL